MYESYGLPDNQQVEISVVQTQREVWDILNAGPLQRFTANGRLVHNCLILDHSDTTVRLGFVTDIHHDTLDDGTVKRAKPKKGEEGERNAPLPRECDHCGYLKPAGVRKCKCCGWEPKRQSDIENADGELVAMNGKAIKADQATKQAWYSMLLRAVDERGQKEGRAFHLYREKFGVQPSNKFNRVRLQPTQEVRNFLRSRDIAWAKSRHAA
jgi:hypothetical protein